MSCVQGKKRREKREKVEKAGTFRPKTVLSLWGVSARETFGQRPGPTRGVLARFSDVFENKGWSLVLGVGLLPFPRTPSKEPVPLAKVSFDDFTCTELEIYADCWDYDL